MEYILGGLETQEEKSVFLQKYFFNLYNHHKLKLNISKNNRNADYLNRVEGYVIDKIYNIVNQTSLPDFNNPDDYNHMFIDYKYVTTSAQLEIVKKIEVYNLINNPLKYTTSHEKGTLKNQGVDTMVLILGNQSLECLDLHLDDFIQFIKNNCESFKSSNHIISQKFNYLNLLSLLRIWNLSVDHDANILKYLKISQPIFDFNVILKGDNNTLTLQIAEESEIDGFLNEHFKFFKEYIMSNENKKKVFNEDKYFDKRYLITYQKGYLVNYKNFIISSNITHLLYLALYSCLISFLGFQEFEFIQKLIIKEKNLMKILYHKKLIKFTNLFIIKRFFNENLEDINLANKELILLDFLYDKNRINLVDKFEEILSFIKLEHTYLLGNTEDLLNFNKLNMETNIDAKKLNIINSFDLFLVNCIINYDSLISDIFKNEDIIKADRILILLIFKFLKNQNYKLNYFKILVELLSKSIENMEIIYKDNKFNYGKFLINLYTSIKVPINLDGVFKKYDLELCSIIKANSKMNFLKIMLAKQIKYFAKRNINTFMYYMAEEFKSTKSEYDHFNFLLELLWIFFKDQNPQYTHYLPSLVNLLVINISYYNKEMRNVCLEYTKKIFASLISHYPMICLDAKNQVIRNNDL